MRDWGGGFRIKFCPRCAKLVPVATREFKELGTWWADERCLFCNEDYLEEPSHCLICGEEVNPDEEVCEDCKVILDKMVSGFIQEIEDIMTDKDWEKARGLLEERL